MGADYDRIRDPERHEHYVYRLLDAKGRTLYIGCSMNLKLRMSEHRRNGRFGHLLVDYVTIGPFNYQDARRAEAVLILNEKPPYNSEHLPRTYFSHGRMVTARARQLPPVSA